MKTQYCKNCKQITTHKRHIGLGSLFLVIMTGGAWLLCILFYQYRCWICGTTWWESEEVNNGNI